MMQTALTGMKHASVWHLALDKRLSTDTPDAEIEQALASALSQTFAEAGLRGDYKALCLSVPGQSEVEHRANMADPVAIWTARQALQGALGQQLSDQISSCLADDGLVQAAAGRALRNRCLYLGVAAGMDEAVKVAAEQSSDLNMTLSMGGLSALNVTEHPERQACLNRFYERWRSSSLVMEKWLSLEACAPYSGAISQLQRLMGDTVFDQITRTNYDLFWAPLRWPIRFSSIKLMAAGISLLLSRSRIWTAVTRR